MELLEGQFFLFAPGKVSE